MKVCEFAVFEFLNPILDEADDVSGDVAMLYCCEMECLALHSVTV